MTGDSFRCPVEGCPFGEDEEKTRDQVRRHINAKSGDEHADTEALYAALDDQEPGEPDVEEGEAAAEEGESDDEEAEETTEESTDMPTDEEYEQQHSAGSTDDEPEETGETDDEPDDGSTDSSDDGEFSLPFPALDQRTVMLLVAALGLLVLVYVVLNRDSEASAEPAQTSDEDADSGSEAVSNEEVTLIE